MQNKLIREETTGINRVAMPYPVPQGWNDNKGYVKTKVTEDGAQVVTRGAYNYKMEKLIDSITIEAGGNSGPIYLNATDERDIILYVSIDKQPWTLMSRTYFGRVTGKATFPRYYNHTETYADNTPAFALLLGISPDDQGLGAPTSIEEAKDIKVPLTETEYIRIDNGSEETATVTIHVLRIWG